jgi:hypothetical protein
MNSLAMREANATNRWRWLWYTAIAICLCILIAVLAFLFPQSRLSVTFNKWAKFTIYTVGFFGYLIKWGWRYRKILKFWALFLAFLLGHIAIFLSLSLPLFSRQGPASNLILGMFAACEFVVMATIIAFAMHGRL